jgi:hypothetical protein
VNVATEPSTTTQFAVAWGTRRHEQRNAAVSQLRRNLALDRGTSRHDQRNTDVPQLRRKLALPWRAVTMTFVCCVGVTLEPELFDEVDNCSSLAIRKMLAGQKKTLVTLEDATKA